jgi:hypothetical protein
MRARVVAAAVDTATPMDELVARNRQNWISGIHVYFASAALT